MEVRARPSIRNATAVGRFRLRSQNLRQKSTEMPRLAALRRGCAASQCGRTGTKCSHWVYSFTRMDRLARFSFSLLLAGACLAVPAVNSLGSAHHAAPRTFLGFDRNSYPGDAALPRLRKTFAFTGYWLNTPPSARVNTWLGKRALLRESGFGFLVLFNGRLDVQLAIGDPAALGRSDALAAIAAARREGFPPGTILLLDQEEGGRLLPEQRGYLFAWVDGVNRGGYLAGVYSSGISALKENGDAIVTAEDIRNTSSKRQIAFWVYNDVIPPAPGCVFPRQPPAPSRSGVRFAAVWQFAQSPGRGRASSRFGYDRDGNCYAPGFAGRLRIHVDVDVALSPDPSHGRG